MSYATQYADASLTAFQNRVQLSICNAAIAIINESPSTASHQQRIRLAYAVLQNPSGMAATMASGVVADGVTNNSSADAQIDTRVSGIWNSYAQ